jgi:hypothetical protein
MMIRKTESIRALSVLAVLIGLVACATTATSTAEPYGPLSFNMAQRGDFYITQRGVFAPAVIKGGVIVIHLANEPFQIGTNSSHTNICLTQAPAPEIEVDSKGFKASCLAGPFTGAREPDSDALVVYSGKKWGYGNSALTQGVTLQTKALNGYAYGYQINRLVFVNQPELSLSSVRGTVYGWIVVNKHDKRINRDIMPIQLVFPEK